MTARTPTTTPVIESEPDDRPLCPECGEPHDFYDEIASKVDKCAK